MKNIVLILALFVLSIGLNAQEKQQDSTKLEKLDEVLVKKNRPHRLILFIFRFTTKKYYEIIKKWGKDLLSVSWIEIISLEKLEYEV